jgi:soluble lytic murein transglycosylase
MVEWYGKAAEHGTTFYGQLAGARLGMDEPKLALDGWPTNDQVVAFQSLGPIRVAAELVRIGHKELAELFLFSVYRNMETETDAILLADMALKSDLPKVAVFTARRAARLGATLVERGYPVIELDPEIGPDIALVHAIIRQESSFDREAMSRVGARGLMQLMPATAKQTSASIDLPYRLGGLLTDGAYNISLGRAYLRQMLDRFDGSLVMAIASYNAGPQRVDQWIIRNGDPRDPKVDIVDWIELIPFSETRNYVQRVLEALQVYRSRLATDAQVVQAAGPTAAKARDVWCVFKCGVLLDGGKKPAAIVVENEAKTGD